MAVQLNKQIQLNVGVIVSSSIEAVRVVRNQEQSRQESLFQQAVSDGMSYEAQVKFREKQLKELGKKSFGDPAYKQKIQDSIAATKKLARFQKYRTNYTESLGELNAGRINELDYINNLNNLLDQTDDVDLMLEMQNNITQAESKVTLYKKTLLDNQVKKAKYDGTEKTLDTAIDNVRIARSEALISGNKDAVEEYDLTISSLNSQKVQANAEDVIDDIALAGVMSEFNAKSKLDKLGTQIQDADFDVPITIGGKRYGSEQEYWQITRNAYLTGNGSGIFTDFFGEIDSQYETTIAAEVAKFGFVSTSAMNTIKSDFTRMRNDPAFAPFLGQLDSIEVLIMSDAVDTMASVVVDRAGYTGDFTKADATLKSLGATYGVDTLGQQLALGNVLNQQVNAAIAAGQGVPPEAALIPASDLPVPGIGEVPTPSTPTAASTPGGVAPAPAAKGRYVVQQGDTLSAIAQRNNMSLDEVINLNPALRADPDAIKIGTRLVLEQPTQETPVSAVDVAPVQPLPPASVPQTPPVPAQQEAPAVKTESQRLKEFSISSAQQTPVPTSTQVNVYEVVSGDTLGAIAARNKTTVQALAEKNKISDPDKISVGQKINL